jgi:hypothetical protein
MDFILRVVEHHEGPGYRITRVCPFGFWEGVCDTGTGCGAGSQSARRQHTDTLVAVA